MLSPASSVRPPTAVNLPSDTTNASAIEKSGSTVTIFPLV